VQSENMIKNSNQLWKMTLLLQNVIVTKPQ